MLASTKYWRPQNVGVDKMLAQSHKDPFIVWLHRIHSCWLLPDIAEISYFSPWWCWSICIQSPRVVLLLAAMLLWADSLVYCTGLLYRPTMLKTSQILARTKYRCPPKITWFSPSYSSLCICSQASYQKVVKTKSDHNHWSQSLSNISSPTLDLEIRGCPRDPPLRSLAAEMRCGWQGGVSPQYLLSW